jgi:hypothetical protein
LPGSREIPRSRQLVAENQTIDHRVTRLRIAALCFPNFRLLARPCPRRRSPDPRCTLYESLRQSQALGDQTPEGWPVYRRAHVQTFVLFLGGAALGRRRHNPRGRLAAPPKNKKRDVGCPRIYTKATPPGLWANRPAAHAHPAARKLTSPHVEIVRTDACQYFVNWTAGSGRKPSPRGSSETCSGDGGGGRAA